MTFSEVTEALRTALVARILGGDETLPGIEQLLGLDREDGTPAMYVGNKSQSKPVYPSLTYRISTGTPDNQMRTGGSGVAGAVIRLRLEFEVWTGSSDTGAVAQIAGPIEALLHNRGFNLSSGRCYRSLFVTCQPDLFDKTSNAWYGLFAYELHVQLP